MISLFPMHAHDKDAAPSNHASDPQKPRPLPTPPLVLHHSPSPSYLPPPPPYSTLEDELALPAPEAPVIMTPPPNEQSAHARHPYDSFLCHSPPANTWIAVETSQSEYSLLVRLPGFTRDGITISTRKRRILHVVADSWEPEGGHFERRVSFGYDAELAQVRAEFDGEMLRVVVPRRVSAVTS
ncbi:hypothetical protein HD554DRAFT_2078874 [Boletus coccyginus]|nr:hypothetical protein HD554DRAFT_2078874 [Boletus coccyginus]